MQEVSVDEKLYDSKEKRWLFMQHESPEPPADVCHQTLKAQAGFPLELYAQKGNPAESDFYAPGMMASLYVSCLELQYSDCAQISYRRKR